MNPSNTKISVKAPSAAIIIFAFGLVSLAADMTYEAGISMLPAYLESLGLAAVFIGTLMGFGDFLSHATRIFGGVLSDKTQAYWIFIVTGYGAIIVVPLMGFTSNWLIIAIFIFTERIAKGFRSPARDTVLSTTTKKFGTGKAFGFHQFFDQLGGITGPLIVAVVLFFTNSFSDAFLFLFIPYTVLVIILWVIYNKLSTPTQELLVIHTENETSFPKPEMKLSQEFQFYCAAVFANTIALFPASLILFVGAKLLDPWEVALIYSLIQIVYTGANIIAGWSYDRWGAYILTIIFALSVIPGVLVGFQTKLMLVLGAIVFGFILGAQKSVYRANIAEITSIKHRGTAYGIFGLIYGVGLILSGFLFGWILDTQIEILWIVIIVLIVQALAIILLVKSLKQKRL